MLYDTHCHPNYTKQKDISKILKSFKENHIEAFLNAVWTNSKTNQECIDLSKNNNFVFACIWYHPWDIDLKANMKQEIQKLENLYLENKDYIVWIWECWLDYFHLDKNISIELQKEKQKEFFIAQINLAKKYMLPLIIHNREAKDDIFEILTNSWYKKFVFHCYTENLEYAQKLLEYAPNCMISFSWIVTFNNAKQVQETAKNIPLKNILVETDAPRLTPTPFRWKEENEPDFTKYVLDFICELRKENSEIIKKEIFENSINFFGIGK